MGGVQVLYLVMLAWGLGLVSGLYLNGGRGKK